MKRIKISVLDYGMGNVLSVLRAFEKVGHTVDLISTPGEVLNSRALVIPGVGAFPNAMTNLAQRDLIESIKSAGRAGKSIVGICLGMQLLFENSYEFTKTKGLGLIEGEVRPIDDVDVDGKLLKVPHVGWNSLTYNSNLIKEKLSYQSGKQDEFYFVHSLHVKVSLEQDIVAVTNYGGHDLTAIVASKNYLGFQFHPEKSGKKGLELIQKIHFQ